MDRLSLQAQERTILGKKVKKIRKDGKLPGHVYGKGIATEVVSVDGKTFLKTFKEAGETGLIDLKVGEGKAKPVLIRGVQYDPTSGELIHIDFYQVNLSQKIKAPVPLTLIGEQPESVKLGEAIILQTLNEVEIEALPADLVEKIEVDITSLKNIDDAITVSQLMFDRSKLAVAADNDSIVVKLAPAVTEEMKKQMEEEAAQAAAEAAVPVEGEAPASAEATAGKPAEGEAGVEEAPAEGEAKPEATESKEEAPKQ